MELSLKQAHLINQLTEALYGFLSTSGFASVAQQVGVPEFWDGGNKRYGLRRMLELTLARRPQRFVTLVHAIILEAVVYRNRHRAPIKREEIDTVNELLLQLGFKIPELWSPEFLASFPTRSVAVADAASAQCEQGAVAANLAQELERLRDQLYSLAGDPDRQRAGYALERLLNRLFTLFDLAPRSAFRVAGEQIDGSFVLDYEVYLLEAKWTRDPISEEPLLVFRGIIQGKSPLTRGVFVSINGFTNQSLEAIMRGKSSQFFLMDGYDLHTVLDGRASLPELLRFKWRKLAEEGILLARLDDQRPISGSERGRYDG